MNTKALRQKILDLAIRGKLVPQDPNDEPAEVLLERIREQKQQMLKEGKLKKKDLKNDTIIFKGEDNLHYEKFQDGTVKCIEDEIPFEVPEGWEWTRLRSIIHFIRNGATIKQYGDAKGLPITRIETIASGTIDRNRFGYANIFEVGKYESYILKDYDILMSHINSPKHLGKCALYEHEGDEKIIHGMNLLSIRTFSCSLSKYMCIVFRSTVFKDFVWEHMKQAVNQASITTTSISNSLFPLPPEEEQKRIVDFYDDVNKYVTAIDIDKDKIIQDISLVKSKILDLAIRGKLVPQDPNDEPASVLLERIRAEKEELIKQGKIKRDKKESVIFKGDDNSYYEKVGNKVNCIDEEIPFELPEYWAFIRLKTTWELISGRDLSPSEYNDKNDGIPYITGASNFRNGYISLVRWTTVPQVITRRGDLLLTCKGTIGEIAHNNFGEAHIARQIMAIHNNYSLNVDFLALCIEYSMPKIKQAAKGLIPGISREDILSLVIPIPPIKEQENICNKLKVTFSAIEHIEKSLN